MIPSQKIIALITAMLLPCLSSAQGIVAGIAGPGDIYTDIDPDSVFQAAPVHLSPFPGGEIKIDIDRNGTFDFVLGENGNGGLGGGGGGGAISPLTPGALIRSFSDTSMGYPGIPVIALVAVTVAYGMPIGSDSGFRNSGAYFWASHYGMSTGPSVSTWVNIGVHYVGAALVIPGDTLYGWIRVNISTGGGAYIMTVSEYACNINPNAIPVTEPRPRLEVIPNPFTASFTVNLPGQPDQGKILITTLTGKILLEKPVNSNTCPVDAAYLPRGMYLLSAETPDGRWTTKLVKL